MTNVIPLFPTKLPRSADPVVTSDRDPSLDWADVFRFAFDGFVPGDARIDDLLDHVGGRI